MIQRTILCSARMCYYLDNTSRYSVQYQYVVCNFLHIVEISAPQQDTSSVVVSALGGGACCWWGSCIITRTCKINDAYLRVPAGTRYHTKMPIYYVYQHAGTTMCTMYVLLFKTGKVEKYTRSPFWRFGVCHDHHHGFYWYNV